tara:strand:- start:39506 stop:40372 length:867 start_codon:yes stop_codon:yes gene_type:complete
MYLEYAPYALSPQKSLYTNSESSVIKAYLIRIHFATGWGYSLLQTWPHLGEPSLMDLLLDISGACKHPYSQSACYFAKLDAQARADKVNLLENLPKVPNYYSIGELDGIAEIPSGACIKWKWPKDTSIIRQLHKKLKNYRHRIDLNGREFDESLLEGLAVDYIEDPGSETTYAVAYDSEKPKGDGYIFIVKPVKEACAGLVLERQSRVIFTSNMDHPLGQIQALFYAASFYQKYPQYLEPCGIFSHSLFESNAYTEALHIQDRYILGAEGYGFGFDTLLEKEEWTQLK